MKYIVQSKKNIDRMDENELLLELLKLRGVEQPTKLLSLSPNVLNDTTLFKNIEKAVDVFINALKHKKRIHIIVDSDVDGLTSASMMWLYIAEVAGIYATYDTHEGKQHGLYKDIADRIPSDTELLIVPDAGSSDYEWHAILANRGLDVLVLDHHRFEHDSSHAIIVNNQDGSYPNTNLTGVGVVFKFIDYVDELMGTDCARNHLGLLGLGQIADMADVRDLETRFLILESLKYLKDDSKLLHTIVEANSHCIQDKITIHNVGWYIAPLLNGCFRQGNVEQKLDMFRALCNFEEERVHVPTRKTQNNPNKEPIVESLAENVVRMMKTLKSQQDSETKKEAKEIEKLMEEQGINVDEDKIIILDVTGVLNATHTGLTANALAKKYYRPVLLLNHAHEDSPTYGGSGRNYDKFAIVDLSEFLMSSGLIKCKGHDNSFGIELPLGNLEPLKAWIVDALKDVDVEPVYHVDFEFNINKLKEKHVRRVGQWNDMWGGKSMSAPLFAITNIIIDSADITKNKSFVRFTIERNGEYLTFIKKFASDDWYNQLIHESGSKRGVSRGGDGVAGNKKLELTVLGRFSMNEYEGKSYPQIEIVDINSEIADERKRSRRF